MSCVSGISSGITSNCTTVGTGGLEVKVWLGNRSRWTSTASATPGEDNIITTLIPTAGTDVLYPLLGVKKLINAGHERVIAENRPDRYIHKLMFQGFQLTPAAMLNLDNLTDLFAVVELKDKQSSGKGTFQVFGLTHGLYVTSDTRMANDENGARPIEMTTLDGEGEPYSCHVLYDTSYAVTLAALVALET